jgi:hypothetical protein
MTDDMMALRGLVEKSADADCQRRSDVPQKRRFKIPQVT